MDSTTHNEQRNLFREIGCETMLYYLHDKSEFKMVHFFNICAQFFMMQKVDYVLNQVFTEMCIETKSITVNLKVAYVLIDSNLLIYINWVLKKIRLRI